MADSNSFFATWSPRVLSILRIVAALLFMAHGAQKLFSYPPSPPRPEPPPCPCPVEKPPAPAPPPPPAAKKLAMDIGPYLEFFGGLLLLLGLFTRFWAFILSGMMAVAYFGWHFDLSIPGGFWPITNRGELAALYSFVFLYLAVAGGGAWSLDNLLRRRGRLATSA